MFESLKKRVKLVEIVTFKEDKTVLGVKALSFPDGIMDAFARLQAVVPNSDNRMLYGISYPGPSGSINYFAAAEELPDDKSTFGCDLIKIDKGEYLCEIVQDWRSNIPAISRAFDTLITDKRIDPKGYCLEEYINSKDVRCMVPVK